MPPIVAGHLLTIIKGVVATFVMLIMFQQDEEEFLLQAGLVLAHYG